MSEQNYDWGFCGDVRAGRVEHDLPLAFARHRLSAFSAGERAGIERAAEVAAAEEIAKRGGSGGSFQEARRSQSGIIATAIRALIPGANNE
jgi:hypothetical protein